MKEIEIESFENLIELLERPEIKTNDVEKILAESLQVYIDKGKPKAEIIRGLKEYWSKWGNMPAKDRPLFTL